MPSTQHLVRDGQALLLTVGGNRQGVTHHNLIAHEHHLPVDSPGIVCRTLTTPAQRADLKILDPVAEFNEPLRASEEPSLKVGE
jgi:hypothetical protein